MKTKILLIILIITSGIYATEIVKSKTTTFYRYGNVYGMKLSNNSLSPLTSGNFSAGNYFNGSVTRGFSGFNLTGIPTNATINDAKLHLECYGTSTAININAVAGGWQTAFANATGWNSLNYSTIKSYVIKGDGTNNTIDLSSSDLTTYVNSRRGNPIGFGFVVSNEDTTHIKLLEESANHYLTVTYEYSITAPDVPNSLAVSNATITPTGCTLTWSESSGVTDYYNIYIYNANGSLFSKIENVNAKTYTVTGLTPATNYTFKVSAFDSEAGETMQSVSVNCLTKPLAPTEILSNGSCASIYLSWSSAVGQIDGYFVYKDGVKLETTSSLYSEISGLSSNTSYTFAISSYNQSGESEKIFVSCTTLIPPTTPTYLTYMDMSSYGIGYVLRWSGATNATGYQIYLRSPEVKLIATVGTQTSYVLGLLPAGTYIYSVNAYNGGTCTAGYASCGFNVAPSKIKSHIEINDSIEILPKIKVYPNPVIDRLYFDGANEPLEVVIVNLQGQIIKSATKVSEYLDMTKVKSGIYILKIKYNRSEMIYRIIKQ